METKKEQWSTLLKEATTKPGMVSEAYHHFWNYSTGNQLLALFECAARGIKPGPIGTYPRWQTLGRQVRRGEHAITLCMPITYKRKVRESDAQGNETEREGTFTGFIYKRNWFVLAQTEGKDFTPEALPEWSEQSALASLAITKGEFTLMNGNVQGYALPGRKVAISPIAENPYKTLFHELAHILLGHVDEGNPQSDTEQITRSLAEAEAEAVAMLVCESLGLPGAAESRAYIQGWYGHADIPERSAQKIFHAADQIIKAGMPRKAEQN